MARLLGHLLLVFCLVLSGIGATVAATAMPLAHADHASQAAPPDALQDCPSHAPAPTDADCCDPGHCDGACAQHAVAALKLLPVFGSEDLGSGYRAIIAPAHTDPALQQAVRPPIA